MYSLENTIDYIKKAVKDTLIKLIDEKALIGEIFFDFEVEIPAEREHGDLSTNAALILAKNFKMPPRKIAEMIVNNLIVDKNLIEKVEIAGPGFINFFLGIKFFSDTLKEIKKAGENYGVSNYGQNKKVMIEFVSANPTGPMHMGNARLGALGDCLSSILQKVGYNVYKEFYVNDAGNQIEKFGLSLDIRYEQICKGKDYVEIPEDCYQGEDITELSQQFFDIYSNKYINESQEVRKKTLVDFALPKNILRMKQDMGKYKIFYDNWFYESSLYESGEVDRIINLLTEKGLTYEIDGCVWFKATMFGCEKDEVLRRKNGIPTYFAADVAYHYNKFAVREFDVCIDIWGADHHGHVARMKSAMEALGIDKERLHVILVQLVRLIQNGEVVRMSKRTGKTVQLSDLIYEVGTDAARFIFNIHEAGSGMDFDLDLAVKHDSQNPVYYVQYAFARICSVFKQLNDEIRFEFEKSEADLNLLSSESEKKLIYFMASYPLELLKSAMNYDSTKVTRYAITLATLFHKFYSSCKIISEDKNLMYARLTLCSCLQIIIKNILNILKVEAPEVMN